MLTTSGSELRKKILPEKNGLGVKANRKIDRDKRREREEGASDKLVFFVCVCVCVCVCEREKERERASDKLVMWIRRL